MELQTMPLRFRVWDKEEKRFVPSNYDWGFAIRIDGGISHHHGVIDYGWQNRFIISQDTGLKDKNGKSIYTGDICYYAPYERYVPVLYKGGIVVIKIQENEEYYISQHLEHLVVVGNIWQNEDLLNA